MNMEGQTNAGRGLACAPYITTHTVVEFMLPYDSVCFSPFVNEAAFT